MKPNIAERVVKPIVLCGSGCETTPTFLHDKTILHPIPKRLTAKIREGEAWEGVYSKLVRTQKTDRKGNPVFIQRFIPIRMTEQTEIHLPMAVNMSLSEYLRTEATVIVRSGTRLLKQFLLAPGWLRLEPFSKTVVGRLCYEYGDVKNAGLPRFFSGSDIRTVAGSLLHCNPSHSVNKETPL